MHSSYSSVRRGERGAMSLVFAVLLVAIIGIAAYGIDIGSALVTRAQLQNACDAGMLAGGRELVRIYEGLPSTTSNKTYELTSGDKARIWAQVSSLSEANQAGGVDVSVLQSDIVYGTYDHATGEITPATRGVRAIGLVTRRDEEVNGVIQTTLGRVLGVNELSVRATGAVGISALGTFPAGYGEVPVGISSFWFDSHECGPNSNIRFFPTGTADGCAGWHTFEDYPANASRLGRILDGLRTDTYDSPETTAGQTTYNFTGGTVAARFPDMEKLYDAKKDAAGNWDVIIPVYEDTSCANPTGAKPIIGFARARIFEVTSAPDKTITANVECGVIDVGAGNGPNDYGVLYASPGVIQ